MGADGILKPGWTWELEAAVNGDICLAHWLMSERSPRVIRLQRNFLHGWHSSLREETTKDTLGRGWGWDVRSQIVEVGAVPRRNVAFTPVSVLKGDRAGTQLTSSG